MSGVDLLRHIIVNLSPEMEQLITTFDILVETASNNGETERMLCNDDNFVEDNLKEALIKQGGSDTIMHLKIK